jgi:AraC-like DNA-binding protein
VLEAGRALPGHQAAVRALCWAALARLLRLPGASGRGADPREVAALRPVLERMARADLPTPSMIELAALCRSSEATLRRRFRRAFGMNTKAWLDRNRILRAAERLRQPGATILQAALASGFASSSGFTRQFRSVLGMSPRSWCRRALSKSARS